MRRTNGLGIVTWVDRVNRRVVRVRLTYAAEQSCAIGKN